MPLHRFTPFNTSLRSKTTPSTSPSTPDLRPCQRAYLGESNARRLLKRSQLSKKATTTTSTNHEVFPTSDMDDDENPHEEAALEAFIAASAQPRQPAMGYSVQCYATHAEDAARQRAQLATEKEKQVLFASINSSRHAEGSAPLRLKPLLERYAQDHADALSSARTMTSYSTSRINLPNTSTSSSSRAGSSAPNSVVVVMAPSGARVARLTSPPRIGALACGELWYGGKYRRHLYDGNASSTSSGWFSDKKMGRMQFQHHPDDCPCHLRMVFETMVDEGWKAMGIGRSVDGRWVVELGQ